uniref:Uncharacterized protein n=1 Tax=viral metagenome TaxID=1070528 RepID=A0A2V0RLQ4_9ZZZZ
MAFVYFSNSWRGNSWAAKLRQGDTKPVFWTKNEDAISDQIDADWKAYDEKFSGRGMRIAYDVFTTKEDVLREYKFFINKYKSEAEAHVWIQGTLDGLGPDRMLRYLRANGKRA